MLDIPTNEKLAWNPYNVNCPCRDVLSTISDKWALLIIGALMQSSVRFNSLARQIEGVSPKMLAQTLKNLEQQGLVLRTIFPTVPVTVEYALTDLGRSLEQVLSPFRNWAVDNMDMMIKAQENYNASR
jgi:DNA-binding HxlR family transcriptional regulator